ncbi:unnamed protein product [Cochlearia groenlandica]
MMPQLPQDLIDDILSRVPATSLKRLRSTCKRWDDLFDDRLFSIKHSDKAPKESLILMLNNSRICAMSIDHLHNVKKTGELSLVINPRYSSQKIDVFHVFHCQGLLLCVTKGYKDDTRLMLWNPCTDQKTWIHVNNRHASLYALGFRQDNNSYKILSLVCGKYFEEKVFEIYDFNSNTWRILDITTEFRFGKFDRDGVYMKGKTYWIVTTKEEKKYNMSLLSFDYTTERFERLCLPRQCTIYQNLFLSVVRGEKLCLLIKGCNYTSKREIWVTNNKIGHENKTVSWNLVLEVDLDPNLYIIDGGCFLVDEEEKVLIVCCDIDGHKGVERVVCIVGEDNKVTQVNFDFESSFQFLFSYVPSLTQF